MGLLSSAEANLFKKTKGLAFSVLTNKYNLSNFAVLSLNGNDYFIEYSTGFDAKSIIMSESTKSFWDGTIPLADKEYTFKKADNSISGLLQFFSEEMQENLSEISVIKNDSKVFILINQHFTSEIINSMKNLEEENSQINDSDGGTKLSINFEEAIESYTELSGINESKSAKLKSALFCELSMRVLGFFNSQNYSINKETFTVEVITKNDFSEDLLTYHIVMNLKEVIENSAELSSVSIEKL